MEKKCTKCKEIKPITQFYIDKQKSSGYRPDCKSCVNSRQRIYDPIGARRRTLKYKYGITIEDYGLMYFSQNGKCKICGVLKSNYKDLAVDHDHSTGKVRGLLCDNCNVGLGNFKDNIVLLTEAIKYLLNE